MYEVESGGVAILIYTPWIQDVVFVIRSFLFLRQLLMPHVGVGTIQLEQLVMSERFANGFSIKYIEYVHVYMYNCKCITFGCSFNKYSSKHWQMLWQSYMYSIYNHNSIPFMYMFITVDSSWIQCEELISALTCKKHISRILNSDIFSDTCELNETMIKIWRSQFYIFIILIQNCWITELSTRVK